MNEEPTPAQSLTPETILQATPWCVVRPQEKEYLIYNQQTDEMHLIPATGFFVYKLCDGRRTVADLSRTLAKALEGGSSEIRSFLLQLIQRGIVEDARAD